MLFISFVFKCLVLKGLNFDIRKFVVENFIGHRGHIIAHRYVCTKCSPNHQNIFENRRNRRRRFRTEPRTMILEGKEVREKMSEGKVSKGSPNTKSLKRFPFQFQIGG